MEAFVHGVVDALVGFRHPSQMGELGFIFFNHLNAFIRRGAINDNVFKLLISLTSHALHGLLKACGVIAVDGNDGKFIHSLSNKR